MSLMVSRLRPESCSSIRSPHYTTLAQLAQDLTVDCSKELATELAIHLEKKFATFVTAVKLW
jgi:hypothetical protein